jgi:murein L,D-transpeptidase YcbB/YkuD
MMPVKRIAAVALLLGVALPGSALAENENGWGRRNNQPGISIVNIFGWGKMRRVEIRDQDPYPSVSVEGEPAPPGRLITVMPTEGNLTYVPEKLESLGDRRLNAARPTDSLAAAIYDQIKSDEPGTSVLPAERKVILAYYRNAGFKPLWSGADGISDRARSLLALFRDAEADGLDPADYALEVLGGFDVPPGGFVNDPEHLARLDLELTAAAMTYARHASGGRLVPNRLTTYNDIDAPRVDPDLAMRMLAVSPFAAEWLKSLQPAHPAYASFRAELAIQRKAAEENPAIPIPAGKRLKLGQSDVRVPALRRRLGELGLLPPAEPDYRGMPAFERSDVAAGPANISSVVDKDVVSALKALQKKHNLRQTGNLDDLTLRVLNSQDTARNIARLITNMERLRWLPRDLGSRYILVNQAAFKLWVMDKYREVWSTNVVVGKPDTQTAAFHDQMETVVFNPAWGVPPSILTNEMLPILWRDPSYLDRKGFTVVERSGRKVRSIDVDWAAYGSNAPFSIMQPPGEDNALGEVKFLFPNRHDIYMHDTPSRQLFSRPVRSFSHGCVRVQDPRRLAEIVLAMQPDAIAKKIDSGRSQSVSLKEKLPVHLTYFTAWPDARGRIEYFPDIYGRDTPIDIAFGQKRLALR